MREKMFARRVISFACETFFYIKIVQQFIFENKLKEFSLSKHNTRFYSPDLVPSYCNTSKYCPETHNIYIF